MNSKSIWIWVVVIAVIVAGVVLIGGKKSQAPTVAPVQQQPTQNPTGEVMSKNEVTMQNFAFHPATLTVKAGDKVTWSNKDSAGHSATADDGSFDTGIISPGQSGSFTFAKPGTYKYHCTPHPFMQATIVVQ